uniref:Fibrinogen C-terminal domain-containing protein n=1 Tax=Panagrellus redivivus TaxID=6233 RepID=A0A7E4VJ79_PANRE
MGLYLFAATLAVLSTVANADYVISLQLNEYNVGQGFLADGNHCSDYWFRGSKCNINLKVGIGFSPSDTTCDKIVDLGNVTTNANRVVFGDDSVYKDWSNPMLFPGTGLYQGFVLCVEANDGRGTTVQLIDSFTSPPVPATSQADFTFYSHPRSNSPEPTLVGFAWIVKGDVPDPHPTPSTPAPPSTTTVFGQTTTTTAPPIVYHDCNDVVNNGKTSGVYSIQLPNGETVDVYCEIDSKTKTAETVIQSRGETNAAEYPIETLNFDGFTKPYGEASATGNFWLGLENMHSLTTSKAYNMVIRVCCGNKLVTTQFYDNVTVGDADSKYIINGIAEQPYGLGFKNPSTDFGKKFSANDEYNSVVPPAICKIAAKNGTTNEYIGGWWFGTCANNLNGHYYAHDNEAFSDKETCTLNKTLSANGPGIELQLGSPVAPPLYDYHSYTRVRMSLYTPSPGIVPNSNICK